LCFVDPEEDIIDVEEEDDDEDDEVDDEAVGCAAVVVEPWVERVWVVGGFGCVVDILDFLKCVTYLH